MKIDKDKLQRFIMWTTFIASVLGPPFAAYYLMVSHGADEAFAVIVSFIYWGFHSYHLEKLVDKGKYGMRSLDDMLKDSHR